MKVKLGRNVLGEICSSGLRGWDGCDSNALYCIHIDNSQRMNVCICVYESNVEMCTSDNPVPLQKNEHLHLGWKSSHTLSSKINIISHTLKQPDWKRLHQMKKMHLEPSHFTLAPKWTMHSYAASPKPHFHKVFASIAVCVVNTQQPRRTHFRAHKKVIRYVNLYFCGSALCKPQTSCLGDEIHKHPTVRVLSKKEGGKYYYTTIIIFPWVNQESN